MIIFPPMQDKFYQQFDDPDRAFNNLPALVKLYTSNPNLPFPNSDSSHIDFAWKVAHNLVQTPYCIKNSPTCLSFQQRQLAAIKEFEDGFPNACGNCGGTGAICYSYDPSPAGVSLAPGMMTDCDPCPVCIEKGFCPKCGKRTLDQDGTVCSFCGWDWDSNSGPRKPDFEGCCCNEDEDYAF